MQDALITAVVVGLLFPAAFVLFAGLFLLFDWRRRARVKPPAQA